MKLCTIYSDSHEPLFRKIFLPSLVLESGMDLIVRKIPQLCKTGKLFDKGWVPTMTLKDEFIVEVLRAASDREICIFSDADVRFYTPIKDDIFSHMHNKDMVFMKDHNDEHNCRNAGFFAVKSSGKTRNFFESLVTQMRKNPDDGSYQASEQATLNTLLRSKAMSPLKIGTLPTDEYYTHGLHKQGVKDVDNAHSYWWEQKTTVEKNAIYVPKALRVHHANWCNWADSKMELLTFVKSKHDWKMNN